MADIFISYSKARRAATETLAEELQAQGFSVWWDADLVPGERYQEVINAELDRARAVIVIWTKDSIKSQWVYSEAQRAANRGVLITVREPDITPDDIPLPYNPYHTELLSDRAAIGRALARFGLVPKEQSREGSEGHQARRQNTKGTAEGLSGDENRKTRQEWEQDESAESDALSSARNADSVAAYDSFIARYPSGRLIRQATNFRTMALARDEGYRIAMASNDPRVLRRFVKNYRGTHLADQVAQRLDQFRLGKKIFASVNEQPPAQRKLLAACFFCIGAAILYASGHLMYSWLTEPTAATSSSGGRLPQGVYFLWFVWAAFFGAFLIICKTTAEIWQGTLGK
jgi:hypothetical protein